MKKLPKRERLAKAAEYLDLVHLSRFADLYLGQLSGGMKQRVALARLFALDPEIMLMDEPFGALNFSNSGIAAGGVAIDLAARPQDGALRHP